MKKGQDTQRIIILGVVFILAMLIYSMRLMRMQIVDGESYMTQRTQGSSRTQKVSAARGEVVDRYGIPFTFNEIGYAVMLDRALMPYGIDNNMILKLIYTMSSLQETWDDILPISDNAPFSFLGDDLTIQKLRSILGITEHATAEDAMFWIKSRYKLEEFSDKDARMIAGVRYGMEQMDFSLSSPYMFSKEISLESVVYLKQRSNDFQGLDIYEIPKRNYSDPTTAPHVIGRIGPMPPKDIETYQAKDKGYTTNDYVGLSGIERAYEDYLRGTDGKKRVYLNVDKEIIDVVEEQPAIAGHTITLSLDKGLQKIAIESLEKQIKYLNATAPSGQGKEANAGAVAAVDIKTGEILVLASYPTYDLSTFGKDFNSLNRDPLNPLFNRALMGQYTPGSIFKPVISLAGLNEGVISATSRVTCNRVYTYLSDYQPTCLGYHGSFTVVDALRQSCNIFFYDTGRQLGIQKINDYAKMLGLGVSTGIEIGEEKGKQSDPLTKNPGDVLQASIGQMGNVYTPLQLANYTATIARKGVLLRSTIINSINTYNFEETIYRHTPEIISTANIPSKHFDTVIEGMIQASHIGTAARTFRNYPVQVASKTGTPQTAEFPNSTFIAFAPADDPQIAIAVVIEKGWHGYTGAPVAKSIFDATLFPDKSSSTLIEYDTLLG